jgi:hypothetical protein
MPPDPASAHHVILCLNSGSSSLKFALYSLGEGKEVRLAHGAAERIGLAGDTSGFGARTTRRWSTSIAISRPCGGGRRHSRGGQDLGFTPAPWAIG